MRASWKWLGVAGLVLTMSAGAACRRENPAPPRTATAAAGQAAAQRATAAAATVTAVAEVTAVAARPAGATVAAARMGKVSGGNLGVAATGISAGIQLWSKPGGILAGGATMTGTVSDGTVVEIVKEDQYLGQKYFQIRPPGADPSRESWIEGRFLEPQ